MTSIKPTIGLRAQSQSSSACWLKIKAWLVWFLVKIVISTVRVKRVHLERLQEARRFGKPILYAFWHGRQFLLFKHRPEKKLMILASMSRDGQLQREICSRFGLDVVRGSSSRGGLAGMIRLAKGLRSKTAVAMAVDGPRGPLQVAKPGVVALARQTGSPIVPVSVGMRRYWELKRAWDRFRIPVPFTRAMLGYGRPIDASQAYSSQDVEHISAELTRVLNALTDELDASILARAGSNRNENIP